MTTRDAGGSPEIYAVYAVEQGDQGGDRESLWSRHATPERALAAARKYQRKQEREHIGPAASYGGFRVRARDGALVGETE